MSKYNDTLERQLGRTDELIRKTLRPDSPLWIEFSRTMDDIVATAYDAGYRAARKRYESK